MSDPDNILKGRGTAANPTGRFERLVVIPDPDGEIGRDEDDDAIAPRTEFFHDSSRTIIARNDSPDIPFDASLNPYRGCEHGCIYCFARPMHEWLGFSAGLDFETKIMVKDDAPDLLRKELSAKGWRPQTIAIGTATDPYQPIERKLRITRRCLEVLREFGNPFLIVTKNRLVARDADILAEAGRLDLAAVYVSVTTLDVALSRVLEPRASAPRDRLAAIKSLSAAGVPTGVLASPIIPGLTDHEIPAIVKAAAAAGAKFAGYQLVRLPHGVADLFDQWLRNHRPGHADKVMARIRESHGGQLDCRAFSVRSRGQGAYAQQLRALFDASTKAAGIAENRPALRTDRFRRPTGQLELF